MATQNAGGYDQDFLDPPTKLKKHECPLCLLVTREPHLSLCCGQHFCQSCINRILTDRKPCPLCKESSFTAVLDKKQKRKILQLKVRCSMRIRGCGWTGELGELATHTTDTRNGDCQFVDVVCPNNCGETHQKRHLRSHTSDTCRKRPFTCEHCKFKSTYELVCKHYDECAKFPLKCPNKCEIVSVERGKMKEHLSECPLQLVDCEYAYAGCSEKIQRKDLAAHMEQNVQKHLLWAFVASQKQTMALEQNIQERVEALELKLVEERETKDRQLGELEDECKKKDRKLEELYQKLEEKDRQIEQLRDRVTTLENITTVELPRVKFTVPSYAAHKKLCTKVAGPTFYTASRGAKVQVYIYFYTPYTGSYKNLHLELDQLPGEYDDEIQWPVKCTVTVHLLNQLSDRDHISGSQTYSLAKPKTRYYTGEPDPLKVPYETIEGSKPGVQYLKDDRLKFKVYVELARDQ